MSRTPAPANSGTVLEDLPFYLVRAALGFRRFSDQTLRSVGLPDLAPGLASVLHAIDELGVCTVARLVEKTHLPNGTLTGLLDDLEAEGSIKRTRNPQDGRSWLVGLTQDGYELCAKLNERHREVMRHFGGVLSKKETAELTRLLGKVTECMRAYAPDTPKAKAAKRSATKPVRRKAKGG